MSGITYLITGANRGIGKGLLQVTPEDRGRVDQGTVRYW
jgi:NAD(P)-dependent dehydrogenase (short-subunit alcohol dehydrogenase family)